MSHSCLCGPLPLPTATTRTGGGKSPGQGWSQWRRCPPGGWQDLWTLESCQNMPGGPGSCAGSLCPQRKEPGAGAQSGGRTPRPGTQTGPHPTGNIQQSSLSPGPALPLRPGNSLLRRPVLTLAQLGPQGRGEECSCLVAPMAQGRQSLSLKGRQAGRLPALPGKPSWDDRAWRHGPSRPSILSVQGKGGQS